ncbi:MAG: hypothetical protein ACRC0X_07335 [Brevinema sp.]
MKVYLILSIIFFTSSTNFANYNFQELSKSYQTQKYGSTIKKGSQLLEDSFKNILIKSYQLLPYTRNIIRSNQNYSFDMQNNQVNFNTLIEYTFNYNQLSQISLSLIYAFEEVSYYQTYIEFSHYSSVQEEIPVFRLKDPSQGAFLWNTEESTAYYVHTFPKTNNRSPTTENIVPGLLLKIQFAKNTKYSPAIENIINQLVKETKWNQLQNLYIIE